MAAAVQTAAAAVAKEEMDASLGTAPRFEGLLGWASHGWERLFTRLSVELSAATAWERYVRRVGRAPSWAHAGLLHVTTASLVSSGFAHIGAELTPPQKSGIAHANALLHAARLHSHAVTHDAQRLLVVAKRSVPSLAHYVDALVACTDAASAIGTAVGLPRQLETLHALVTRVGVAVPEADAAYVSTLRGWADGMQSKLDALQAAYEAPKARYVAEARTEADALLRRVDETVAEARRRGVYTGTAVAADRVALSAHQLAERLEAMLVQEVPTRRTQLAALGEAQSLPRLEAVGTAACDVRTCASAWHLLGEWRVYFEVTLLSTPLVKLQAREPTLDAELLAYAHEAAALDTTWQKGTRGGAAAGVGASVSAGAGGGESHYGGDDGGGTRSNVILGQLASEMAAWRSALPLVHKLLHPRMRTAQWQRVFAEVPPPKLTMARELDADDDVAATTDVSDEMVRKTAADEMAKIRAPGSMCLRTLWEHSLSSFAPSIERVLKTTLARAASPSPHESPANRRGAGASAPGVPGGGGGAPIGYSRQKRSSILPR